MIQKFPILCFVKEKKKSSYDQYNKDEAKN